VRKRTNNSIKEASIGKTYLTNNNTKSIRLKWLILRYEIFLERQLIGSIFVLAAILKAHSTMTEETRTCIERLQMMYSYFKSNAEKDSLYLPEFNAATLISDIMNLKESYSKDDFNNIRKILSDVDLTEHKNDSHWYDYKIHLNYILRQHGLNENIYLVP
jgi:hypothetical protein